MKRLFFIILMAFFIPATLLADALDDKLPSGTSTQVKETARQVIELGIKSRSVVKISLKMLESGFTEKQLLSAYDILINAKKQNLPEGPILDKLNEGIAKNMLAATTLTAMEMVRTRYEAASTYAKQLTGDEDHTQDMVREIAECMAAGVETGDIGKVTVLLRQRTKTMKETKAESLNRETLGMIRTLARAGVESRDAVDIVDNAFQKGYEAKNIKGLESSFKSNARWTTTPSDLAKSYSAAIQQGVVFELQEEPNSTMGFGFGPGIGSAPPMGLGAPAGAPPGGGIGGPSPGPGAPDSAPFEFDPTTGVGGGGSPPSTPPGAPPAN